MYKLLAGFAGCVCLSLLVGCGGGGMQPPNTEMGFTEATRSILPMMDSTTSSSSPTSSTTSTTNFNPTSEICKFEDVLGFNRGQALKLLANRADYTVGTYDIIFLSAFQRGLDKLILCQTSAKSRIGYGFEGSPVYTLDGRNIGGVVSFVDGTNQFYVKSIEQILTIINDPSPIRSTSTRASISSKPKWIISGLTADRAKRSLGSYWGKVTVRPSYQRGNPRSSEQPYGIQLGSTVAARLLDGDVANIESYGSMTYFAYNKWVGWGHALDQTGVRSIPVFLAKVDSTAMTSNSVFKLCHGTQAVGALVGDYTDGIVVEPTTYPKMPIAVTEITIDGTPAGSWKHVYATDNGSWFEQMAVQVGLTAPLTGLIDHAGRYNAVCSLTVQVGSNFGGLGFSRQSTVSMNDCLNKVFSAVEEQIANEYTASTRGKVGAGARLHVDVTKIQ